MSDGPTTITSPINPVAVENRGQGNSLRSLPEDCDGAVTPPPGTDDPAQSSAVEPNDGSLSSSINQPPQGGSSSELATDASDADQTPSINGCQECYRRLERYRAIGLSVFMISVFSFGTLTFIALPIGMFIQMMTLRKCKICRRNRREILRAGRRQGL